MKMKILKLSIPGVAKNADISQFLGNNSNIYNGWEIHINDETAKANAWGIIEDLHEKESYCDVSGKNTFFLSAENSHPFGHYSESNWRMNFLNQFNRIYSCHDIFLKNAYQEIPYLPWMINSNHGSSIFAPHKRDKTFFESLTSIPKNKKLSVFCSNQSLGPGHRLRYRFVSKLKEHFQDDLDWYGNGVNQLSEKWNGISEYKYTIVLENQLKYNGVTEKIFDAFLGLAVPIYWGAPNISQYFNQKAIININIENLGGSIETIEESLTSDSYEEFLPYLIESKNRVINDYNFVKRIIDTAEIGDINSKSIPINLKSECDFQPKSEKRVYKIKHHGKSLLDFFSKVNRI